MRVVVSYGNTGCMPSKQTVNSMKLKEYQFWQMVKRIKFPSYYTVLRVQMKMRPEENEKYQKFLDYFLNHDVA